MRSGGATGVMAKGPDDKNTVAFRYLMERPQFHSNSVMCERVMLFLHRMEDKGEVKCIKFSIGIKILAVQRTSKSVVRKLTSSVSVLLCSHVVFLD